MKEEYRPILTNKAQKPYPRYGDNIMEENGKPEGESQKKVKLSQDEISEILEKINRQREQKESRGKKQDAETGRETSEKASKKRGRLLSEEGDGQEGEAYSENDRPEDEQSRDNAYSGPQFEERANAILQHITAPELKTVLARVVKSSPAQSEQIYNDLGEAYGKAYGRLLAKREELAARREALLRTPFPKSEDERQKLREEKTQIENSSEQIKTEINNITSERNAIASLLVSRVGQARIGDPNIEEMTSQILRDSEEMARETDVGRKNQLKEVIRLTAERLYENHLRAGAPENVGWSDRVLKAIGRDEAVTEKFVNRLIFSINENDPYQMHGFYSSTNLDIFSKVNQDLSAETLDRLDNLKQATKAFHDMNFIIKRSFDQFVDQSKALLPKHFDVVMQIPGVAAVFRSYERLIKEELGTETRITEDALSRTKEDDLWGEKGIEIRVKEEFAKRLADGRLTIGGFMKDNGLEDWEVDRAIAYGRNLYRISVRAAEIISQSELHGDQEKFISAPQKELTQLLDPLKFITFRFKPNESRGGVEIAEEILKKRKKRRRAKGEVRIQTLEGIDTDHREMQEIISARGFFETWRMTHALLSRITFEDGKSVTTVANFFKDHSEQIKRFKDLREKNDAGWNRECKKYKLHEEGLEQFKKRKVQELFEPLINNNNLALGVLVSNAGIDVPVELKELLWEKISTLNPGVMASFLTRMEVDRKAKHADKLLDSGVKSLEQILAEHFGTEEQKKVLLGIGEDKKWKPQEMKNEIVEIEKELKELKGKESKSRISAKKSDRLRELANKLQEKKNEYGKLDLEVKGLLKSKEWVSLKDKFEAINEKRLQDEVKRMDAIKKGEASGQSKKFSEYLQEAGLNEKEMMVYSAIKESGQKIAKDLANMKQVTAWFLDDAPIEKAKWVGLGQIYDRQTNDLANFNKGSQKLLELLSDPFAHPPKEVIKLIREAMNGPAGILGLEAAQNNMREIFPQYLEMIQEHGLKSQAFYSALNHAFHNPTSRAQEITGSVESPAITEDATFNLAQDALHAGVLRPEVRNKETGKLEHESTYDELVKNKNLRLAWYRRILWGNMRDFGPVFIIALLIKFFQGTYSYKQR